jgi:transposase-like protein
MVKLPSKEMIIYARQKRHDDQGVSEGLPYHRGRARHVKDLFRDTIQQLFEAEMDAHLGYAKHSSDGDHTGNSRNGYSKKTLKTKFGHTEIRVPRDRNGEFEPHVVKKHETTVNGLEEQIIALYAKGMSTRDIEEHMKELYGIDVSPAMVSKVTDKIMPLVAEWQCRPLDRVYPIVFLDAIHFKVRQENRIINKAAYSVLGISMSGHKDILPAPPCKAAHVTIRLLKTHLHKKIYIPDIQDHLQDLYGIETSPTLISNVTVQ